MTHKNQLHIHKFPVSMDFQFMFLDFHKCSCEPFLYPALFLSFVCLKWPFAMRLDARERETEIEIERDCEGGWHIFCRLIFISDVTTNFALQIGF